MLRVSRSTLLRCAQEEAGSRRPTLVDQPHMSLNAQLFCPLPQAPFPSTGLPSLTSCNYCCAQPASAHNQPAWLPEASKSSCCPYVERGRAYRHECAASCVTTICFATYWLQCIMQWAQRSRECPLCFKSLQLEVKAPQVAACTASSRCCNVGCGKAVLCILRPQVL
jgi:hypothetical protein